MERKLTIVNGLKKDVAGHVPSCASGFDIELWNNSEQYGAVCKGGVDFGFWNF